MMDKLAESSCSDSLQPGNLLFTLPFEIRVMIYEYSLTRQFTVRLTSRTHEGPSLLRTSRQIRREALPIYTVSNDFTVFLPLNKFGRFATWFRETIDLNSKPVSFGGMRIRVVELRATDLPHILPLLELVRTGRLRLTLSNFFFIVYKGCNALRQLAGDDIEEAFKAAFIAARIAKSTKLMVWRVTGILRTTIHGGSPNMTEALKKVRTEMGCPMRKRELRNEQAVNRAADNRIQNVDGADDANTLEWEDTDEEIL
ncbi:hypothetical protein HII31_01078 [Pseudocercospora fuligena]|uniref:F-box domain-containing protein n=1 Tax=Pseudocercospora fuligena TaxID=685502 RepID=A0A8H6VMT2_9PEZI|nr:hypothetical protein HII31_01078 [Pseudocercospora fuligena]